MQYFFYCRDKPGSFETRRALLKAHWEFMSRYIPAMIARGPTMSADGKVVTGSMHIVDLPDAVAAQAFANDDPLARGGVFDDIMVCRFQNLSGRTMWQHAGVANTPRFLFIGEARLGATGMRDDLLAAQRAYLCDPSRAGQVIVFGPLLGADGVTWAGTAILFESANIATAETWIRGEPTVAQALYARTQLLPWRFGGAENLKDLVTPT